MESVREKFELTRTIVRILDGSVSPEEFDAFEQLLQNNPEVRTFYLSIIENTAHFQKVPGLFQWELSEEGEEGLLKPELWHSLAEMEQASPAIAIEKEPPAPPAPLPKPSPAFRKSSLLPMLASIAAALMILLYTHWMPVQDKQHGQILETFQARFDEEFEHFSPGTSLGKQTLRLLQGLVRICTDQGAFVLLEGPAEFRLENDNQLFLIQGKLTADVSKNAEGFTVRTPSACIIDYGTKFGVLLDQYASTEAHVLEGTVEMRLGSNLRTSQKVVRLTAFQAASASGQTLILIPPKVQDFIYQIPSPFEASIQALKPTLYFRLKEKLPQTFTDITGKTGFQIHFSSDLQVVQGPFSTPDSPSYALAMMPEQSVRISEIWPIFENDSGDYTVLCWLRPNTIEPQLIWSHRTAQTVPAIADNSYYRVLCITETGNLEHTAYYPNRRPDARKVNSIVSDRPLEPGRWYFFAVTHAKGARKLMYINGRLCAQSARPQETPLERYTELSFGQSLDELGTGFSGAITDIAFFNRVLSEKEIQHLYQTAVRK
ncbi:MAG TPA: FecR domain-containing protein [Anaerohalosphaeraceae bacterium]|nr:FecR domain-containing protein [Anaerohalosphaeraceae bacterium]